MTAFLLILFLKNHEGIGRTRTRARIIMSLASIDFTFKEAFAMQSPKLDRGHLHTTMRLNRVQIDLSHQPVGFVHFDTATVEKSLLFILSLLLCSGGCLGS